MVSEIHANAIPIQCMEARTAYSNHLGVFGASRPRARLTVLCESWDM